MRMPISLCRFGRHTPVRDEAKWDGLHFIGTCKHCGIPIRRKAHKQWLKEWLADTEADVA